MKIIKKIVSLVLVSLILIPSFSFATTREIEMTTFKKASLYVYCSFVSCEEVYKPIEKYYPKDEEVLYIGGGQKKPQIKVNVDIKPKDDLNNENNNNLT